MRPTTASRGQRTGFRTQTRRSHSPPIQSQTSPAPTTGRYLSPLQSVTFNAPFYRSSRAPLPQSSAPHFACAPRVLVSARRCPITRSQVPPTTQRYSAWAPPQDTVKNRTGVRTTCKLDHAAASTEHTLRLHGQFPGTVHTTEPQSTTAFQQSPTNIYTWRRFLPHVPPKSGVDQPVAILTISRRDANMYFTQLGCFSEIMAVHAAKDRALPPAKRHSRVVATQHCLAAELPSPHSPAWFRVNHFSDIDEKQLA